MAELGAEGAKNMVDATLTAWEFAERKMPVELNRQQIAEARKEVQAYLKTKPLEHDTIYAGTLESRPSGAFVGVLVEPSTFMGESRFGYCGGVVQGQIMRTCRDAGVSYRALDVRRIGEEGLPGVDAMPVLVVTSGSFNSPDAPLRKYVAAGGRLLWIGGWDKGLLGKLSAAIKPADPRLLPVSSKYEDPNCEVVARTAVLFLGDIGKRLGGVPRKFLNNPNTFGWTTPRCSQQVTLGDRDIRPLVAVSDRTSRMIVGAALMEARRARHVFLPQYLLLPYTLTEDPMMDFAEPRLDSVGRGLVLGSLMLLAPSWRPATVANESTNKGYQTLDVHQFCNYPGSRLPGSWPAFSAAQPSEPTAANDRSTARPRPGPGEEPMGQGLVFFAQTGFTHPDPLRMDNFFYLSCYTEEKPWPKPPPLRNP